MFRQSKYHTSQRDVFAQKGRNVISAQKACPFVVELAVATKRRVSNFCDNILGPFSTQARVAMKSASSFSLTQSFPQYSWRSFEMKRDSSGNKNVLRSNSRHKPSVLKLSAGKDTSLQINLQTRKSGKNSSSVIKVPSVCKRNTCFNLLLFPLWFARQTPEGRGPEAARAAPPPGGAVRPVRPRVAPVLPRGAARRRARQDFHGGGDRLPRGHGAHVPRPAVTNLPRGGGCGGGGGRTGLVHHGGQQGTGHTETELSVRHQSQRILPHRHAGAFLREPEVRMMKRPQTWEKDSIIFLHTMHDGVL